MSELPFPKDVLDSHMVALGKTGAGKSSALRIPVEYLLEHKKRVCIIDPKGDWWGLKASADMKTAGFPVITFGEFKSEGVSDVPITRHSGKDVADLVASGNRPMVIGLRGWMPAAQAEFWVDFASAIFNSRSCGGLRLLIDEIQNFAPKERVGFEGENMALHWTKRLLQEGRGLGLAIFCGSQRPQSVHNAILTQCETLIAMRLIHDADCSAVENWLKRTRDKEKRAEIMTTLPDLSRGEAWVWSPEAKFGPERMQFPMFRTFDSFAPLQQQKKVNRRGWADVDLDEVKEKLASVIEEKKANDPRELKAEVQRLKRELEKSNTLIKPATPAAKVEEKRVEVPVLKDGQIDRLLKFVQKFEQSRSLLATTIATDAERMVSRLEATDLLFKPVREALLTVVTHANMQKKPAYLHNPPIRERVVAEARSQDGAVIAQRVASAEAASATDLPPRRQRILDALLFFESIGYADAAREWIAFFCDTSPNSSTYEKDCGAMRSGALITYPNAGRLQLTAEGRSLARAADPITLPQFHDKVARLLEPRRQKIVRALIEVHPDSLRRDQLAERTGTSADSSTFEKDLGAMRSAGLIVYPEKNHAAAADLLFPPLAP